MLLVTEVLADRGFVRTDSRHEIAPRPEMLPRAIARLAPLRAGTGNRTLPLQIPHEGCHRRRGRKAPQQVDMIGAQLPLRHTAGLVSGPFPKHRA